MSKIDIFVSSTSIITLDHKKKLKNNALVGNTGHCDNEIDSSWRSWKTVSSRLSLCR